jgi:small subunit ribosomal protein S4
LRRLFERAEESHKGTDRELLELMERRLDNVVFRLGFTPSRSAARAIVVQGHVLVNGRKSRSPGLEVKSGDSVRIREESRSKGAFKELGTKLKDFEVPSWLALDLNALEGKVVGDPQIEPPFEINLLVESFSK